MKKISAAVLLSIVSFCGFAQKQEEKSLLWRISGNGLANPSYLFGTIHMICKDESALSDSMKKIIRESDEVYFEVDMDNISEMMGMMKQMKMRGDTTLRDLLPAEDYDRVKAYFQKNSSMLPWPVLETYKPILAASLLQQGAFKCQATAMEQVIMSEAKKNNKKIQGLETMGYQASLLDQIPYAAQARQLVDYILETSGEGSSGQQTDEMDEMMSAYREQDIEKLEKVILKSDLGASSYTDLLLYNRNFNWIEKMKQLLPGRKLLFAVGAGHLPGEKGVINLLRKAGYTVSPVRNLAAKSI